VNSTCEKLTIKNKCMENIGRKKEKKLAVVVFGWYDKR
jgi:hypothetical protein